MIPKGTAAKITATGTDATVVRVSALDGADLGWTKKANLTAAADGTFIVNTTQATKRVETIGYGATSSSIPIGTLVIVEEVSPDSDPVGAYVRVAKTKQDGDKRVKGDELGWTATTNLVNGWTENIHSATSTWEGGAFTGQIDVVDIVDEGGDTERASEAGMSRSGSSSRLRPPQATTSRSRAGSAPTRNSVPSARSIWRAPATRRPRPAGAITRTGSPSTSTPRVSTPPCTHG